MPAFSLSEDLDFAFRLADAARAAILPHFRQSRAVDNKLSDGEFDPVTMADRASERAMRDIIMAERPGDGVLGEEFPVTPSQNGRSWTLDPIDGTRGFISGLPTWAVLIAMTENSIPVLGVIDQPYTDERYFGDGQTSELVHAGNSPFSLQTSTIDDLSDATLATTDPYLFHGKEAAVFDQIRKSVRLTRFGCDAYAYACLAHGQVDLVVESGLQPFDVQALIPVVEGAGGVISNWRGGSAKDGGQVVAAATPALHKTTLDFLADAAQ